MCVSWLEGKMDGKEIYAIRVLGRITINFNIRPIHALKAHVEALHALKEHVWALHEFKVHLEALHAL